MELGIVEVQGVRLAVEGCGHGTLNDIYASIEEACKQKQWTGVDLLIIGGDFQAVRNAYDLSCVSMPAKYRSMCDFHEYYSGQRKAPYLTIFVGGNHEASNYLFELYYGGWVAPNIYYMGAANVLKFGPLRIAGLSGIWKGFDYNKQHFERLPYNESEIKSIYHVRELDVRKLQQIQTQVDIGISHDWPQGVEWKGNWKTLFRKKQGFEQDSRSGRLGSVAAKKVLDHLRPRYWFSAHLHYKFAAVVAHDQSAATPQPQPTDGINPNGTPTAVTNADEIDLDMDDDDDDRVNEGPKPVIEPPKPSSTTSNPPNLDLARAQLPAAFSRPTEPSRPAEITNPTTSFLALDKCLPGRHFLQLLEIPPPPTTPNPPPSSRRPFTLCYDREWLSITRAFTLSEPPIFGSSDPSLLRPPPLQSPSTYRTLISQSRSWIDIHLPSDSELGDLPVPENFSVVAPVYDGGKWTDPEYSPGAGGLKEWANPQTERFCEMLGMPNPLRLEEGEAEMRMAAGPREDLEGERFREMRRGRGGGRGGRGGGRGGGGRGRGGRGGRGRGREM